MRIHDQRLANFAKLPAIVPAALRLHSHLVEHAARCVVARGKGDFAHTLIFRPPRGRGQLPDRTGVPQRQPVKRQQQSGTSIRQRIQSVVTLLRFAASPWYS